MGGTGWRKRERFGVEDADLLEGVWDLHHRILVDVGGEAGNGWGMVGSYRCILMVSIAGPTCA